jgi:hypothetical protein
MKIKAHFANVSHNLGDVMKAIDNFLPGLDTVTGCRFATVGFPAISLLYKKKRCYFIATLIFVIQFTVFVLY